MDVDPLLMCKVDRRRSRAPVDRCERPGIAVRQYVDRLPVLALRDFLDQRQTGPPDTEADLDVFVTDGLCILADVVGQVGITGIVDEPEDALDRPAQVYRRRPGFEQGGGGSRNLLSRGPGMQGGKIQAPCSGRADQWRTANVHILDGFDAVAPGHQVVNVKLMRQAPLVDDLDDARVVRLEPDGAKVLARHPGLPRALLPGAC